MQVGPKLYLEKNESAQLGLGGHGDWMRGVETEDSSVMSTRTLG